MNRYIISFIICAVLRCTAFVTNGNPSFNNVPQGKNVTPYFRHINSGIGSSNKPTFVSSNGFLWSKNQEALAPQGDDLYNGALRWKQSVLQQRVMKVIRGGRDVCGSGVNVMIILTDGTKLCARNRQDQIDQVSGELFAFTFSLTLNMTSVPPVFITRFSTSSGRFWSSVVNELVDYGWKDDDVVALIQWMENTEETPIPHDILNLYNDHVMETTNDTKELVTLMHWTDLVIFDYIIAQIDRLTLLSNIFKHPRSFHFVHNLIRDKTQGNLWFIDNEFAFFSGYWLLNPKLEGGAKSEEMLKTFLESVCTFRSSTVNAITLLHKLDDPFELIREKVAHFVDNSIHLDILVANRKDVYGNYCNTNAVFNSRIQTVYQHLQYCQQWINIPTS